MNRSNPNPRGSALGPSASARDRARHAAGGLRRRDARPRRPMSSATHPVSGPAGSSHTPRPRTPDGRASRRAHRSRGAAASRSVLSTNPPKAYSESRSHCSRRMRSMRTNSPALMLDSSPQRTSRTSERRPCRRFSRGLWVISVRPESPMLEKSRSLTEARP
jgi:hypothetical protein